MRAGTHTEVLRRRHATSQAQALKRQGHTSETSCAHLKRNSEVSRLAPTQRRAQQQDSVMHKMHSRKAISAMPLSSCSARARRSRSTSTYSTVNAGHREV